MVSMDQKSVKSNYQNPDLHIFVRDVRDVQGKKRPISVRPWATVKDVKDILQQLMHIPASAQRLFYGPLLTSGKELPNHRTLFDAGIDRSGETILLDLVDVNRSQDRDYSMLSLRYPNDICISSSMYESTPKPLRSLVQQARQGLTIGLKPHLALEGSGGTYFLHDSRKKKIAVFKPADEEPYADNNPRGYIRQYPGDSLRKGIVPGEACIREVAAYLLDHKGFSGVPMTTLVEARHPAFNTNGARLNVSQGGASMGSHSLHPSSRSASSDSLVSNDNRTMKKPGSFQEFINCECTIDDISPSKLSIDEVHKIAFLDIRIMNADRNAANLAVCRRPDNTLELVPIDHGYCLRSVCDVSWMDWSWLDWPQLKQPLSARSRKYIEKLDIEADAQMLQDRLNICEEAVNYFRASSSLLKAGVAAGLTLYDIAIMCCRNDDLAEVPSMMEKLFDMASELAQVAVENERWHHTAASRALEEQLSVGRNRVGINPKMFRKSSSSVEFKTLACQNSDPSYGVVEESPGLVKSCASDTSSDTEEDDECDVVEEAEDCEKWAEKVIADVSIDQITPSRQFRSNSVSSTASSEDGSNDSAAGKGFWHVSPGNENKTAGITDDSSVAWSTDQQSPRNSSASLDESSDTEEAEENVKTPRVSFAVTSEKEFLPPKTVRVTENKAFFPVRRQSSGGMIRSRSYAGLSENARPAPHSSTRKASHKPGKNEETYKKYFHKFIDLVIAREINAALHHSRHKSIDVKNL